MTRIILLATLLLLPARSLAAQMDAPRPLDARLMPSFASAEHSAALRRDHVAGAAYGLAIGAVVGGVGFAATTYIGNIGNPEGQANAVLALGFGGVVGGALGLVAGAIIGAPVRDDDARAHVLLAPDGNRGVAAGLSISLGTRR